MRYSEKGFTMVLSLVLLLAMSLMGGALILIASNDHQGNDSSDRYQQTFYAAEMALLEGENYILNQKTGPWIGNKRDLSKKNLPERASSKFDGTMTAINYSKNATYDFVVDDKKSSVKKIADTDKKCFNSFSEANRGDFYITKDHASADIARSYNLGVFLENSFGKTSNRKSNKVNQFEATMLKTYFFEYFVERIGAASFKGFGQSIKKSASDASKSGIAYRVYGCGIYINTNKNGKVLDEMIVPLESIIVLPQN